MPEGSHPERDASGALGVLVLVVGPSGAGKDTLIRLASQDLAPDPRFLFVRRVVTRDASRWEDHDTLPPEAFEIARQRGDFVLWWAAHGLHYGIADDVSEAIRRGSVAVCNASRGVVAVAKDKFTNVRVVLVTVPADVLAERLKLRGRESGFADRLDRKAPQVSADLVIDNSGAPEAGARELTAFLRDLADGGAQQGR